MKITRIPKKIAPKMTNDLNMSGTIIKVTTRPGIKI
jgi:hypothetical protein